MRDLLEISTLLNVIDKARHWPKLKAIHDRAMQALEDHAAGAQPVDPEPTQAPVEPAPEAVVEEEAE